MPFHLFKTRSLVMTENTHPDNVSPAPTAGGLLKAARQTTGMHLAVLSVNLKVPVRQLEALEADQYLFDQSPVFARGLAASVCRQLRVDPAPILALMPMSANYLEPNGAVRQATIAPADLGSMRRPSSGFPAKIAWMASGMLVLIAALIWLPNLSQSAGFESLRAALSAPESTAPASAPVVEPVGLTEAGASTPPQEPVPTEGSVAQPVLSSASAIQPELVFAAQNMSWIEVRDVQKHLIWNGVLNAGDTKRLPFTLPVSVVVGRSDAVQLSVNGQAFDLKPHTQVNTARFEVKP
jgi:cytoskeleton protein RodZ